jgi:hypothetical protein
VPRDLFDVALEDVHQRGLGLVVEVVTGEELVGAQLVGVPLEQVAAEDPAVRARRHPLGVALDDVVHPEAELILVGDEFVRDAQVVGEFDAGVDALVAVALDPLVDGERDEFDARILLERPVDDVGEDDAVLPAREADHPRLRVLGRGVVGQEVVLADAAAHPFLHGPAETVAAHVQPRVGGVHHGLGAALVAVHARACGPNGLWVSARRCAGSAYCGCPDETPSIVSHSGQVQTWGSFVPGARWMVSTHSVTSLSQ